METCSTGNAIYLIYSICRYNLCLFSSKIVHGLLQQDLMTRYTFASNSIEAVMNFFRQCKGTSFEALLHLAFVHDVPIVCESLCQQARKYAMED